MPKNNPALFQAIFEADAITKKASTEGDRKLPSKTPVKTKKEGDMGEPSPSPFDFDKLLNAVKESISKDTKPPRKPREKPSEEAYKRTLEILAKGRETRKANMQAKKGDATRDDASLQNPPPVEKPIEKPVEGGGSPKAPSAGEEHTKTTNNHQGAMGEACVPQPKTTNNHQRAMGETRVPQSGGNGGGLRPDAVGLSSSNTTSVGSRPPPVIFGKNFRANISRR